MSINDIVISGMSGRFPQSRNVEEFSKNLYSGVDMVTESEDRWPGSKSFFPYIYYILRAKFSSPRLNWYCRIFKIEA